MEGTRAHIKQILLVEDNLADRKLLALLFKTAPIPHQLHFAQDGEEATDFLFQRGVFDSSPRPDLVLLDLNMPGKDGRDVLKELKEHPLLKRIPVIVLTTSGSDLDVCSSYAYQANSYIQKPKELAQFQRVINLIVEYWLGTVELPRFRALLPNPSLPSSKPT